MTIWADNVRDWRYYIKRWARWSILILFLVFTEFITRLIIDAATSAASGWYGVLTSFWTIILAVIMVGLEVMNPDLERIVNVIFGE